MVGRHHVFAPRLCPLHRPAKLASELRDDDLLAVALKLAAEAAADIRSDHAQVVLRNARHQGEEHSKDVRDLRRCPDGDLVAHAHRCRDHRPWLHECRDEPLVDEPALDDDVGLRRHLVVATTEVVDVAGVRALVIVDDRAAIGDRGLHVHDCRQWLVVDDDGLERVGGMHGIGGEHHRDAVTDVTHLVDGKRREPGHDDVIGDGPDARDRAVEIAEFGGAIGGHDIRHLQGARDIKLRDASVGHRAAQDRHVQGAGQLDVVGPVGLAMEEPCILLAANRPAERSRRIGHVRHVNLSHFAEPPIRSAAYATLFTMLW